MDYSNYARIKDGQVSRTPLPAALWGVPPEALFDLDWLPDDYGVRGCQWWPVEDQSNPLTQYQSYGTEVLVMDASRRVVLSYSPVIDWTAAEILAHKASITRHISRLAFRNRLTLAEKIAFEMAQVDNPSASTAARQAAAALRVMEKDINVGQYIDLNAAATQAGVQQLEALGIIAAGRADAIIWGDIQPVEVP